MKSILAIAVALVTAGQSSAVAANAPNSKQVLIARALTAAPDSVAADAAVVQMNDKGDMILLRSGRNGWTCLPHDVGTPQGQPLCLNKSGLDWYVAAMKGTKPAFGKVGYSYMLMGGSVWSNLDPAATKLAAGQKDFVHVPPHVMILNANVAETSGFPSGEANPDTNKPFVMFGHTPYAALIIPVAATPGK